MKSRLLLATGLCFTLAASAQSDTTIKNNSTDTLHVGDMIILRDGKAAEEYHHYHNSRRHYYRPSNVSTNWVIIDIGFANYNDKTNYAGAGAQQFAPGATSGWFNLSTGKSVDVNIWLFMQRVNLISHIVNLKYGFGIELNNYRYTDPIEFYQSPTPEVAYDDVRHYKKNKLAADYATVPLMLNFNFTPHRREGFGLSLGASAGYLYSSRQKTITAEDGKQKQHNNFDLDPWKISWIAELQLGPIKFYGSYATQSMFRKGLDQIPYNIGIRLSNW